MSQTEFAATAAAETVARAVLEEGYALVEGLAPEVTDRAMAELAPHIDAAPYGHTEFLGARTRRLGGLIRKSEAAQQLVIHDLVLAVCDRVLLDQCARYQLNFTGIMCLGPGADAQVLHRDGALYPFRNPHPPTMVSTMWAGSDFTAENGGTQVVPGSHLWEDGRLAEPEEVSNAVMPRGSVLFYQSGTIHGAGANRSTGDRVGLSFQYSLGWLRQEENQHLSNPPAVARHYPEALQRLVGYEFGGPFLGFVEGDDPHRLLEEARHEGPPVRSRPEIDAAIGRVERLRLGNVAAVPTPGDKPRKDGSRPEVAIPGSTESLTAS